jgi:asparagine synthase (glutamine-hydrolysing)
MILEYKNNTFSFNAKVLKHESKFVLTPSNNHEYIISKNIVGNKEQQCLIVNTGTAEVEINASWFGEYPLFYFIRPTFFIISSCYQTLLKKLPAEEIRALAYDRTAIYESLLFNAILRSRTFYQDIKKIIAGKKLTINGQTCTVKEEQCFILPFNKKEEFIGDENTLIEQATGIYEQLVLPEKTQAENILLPLSGGFDSRLLGCLMNKNNVDFHSITFGTKESTEPFVARKIAKALDINLEYLELKDEYYDHWGDEVTKLTGGLSNHRHCHMYACMNEHSITSKHIVHGFLGDVYAGASQPNSASNFAMGSDEAIDNYIKAHAEKSWIWQQMSETEKANVTADLMDIMTDNCKVNLPCHFDEYVHNVDRQFSLIANVFTPIEQFGHVVRPFANKNYALFFNTLPFEYRNNRKLFKQACLKLFPKEFSYGNQDQIYQNNSLKGKFENILSKFYSKVAYSTLKYSKGKFVIRNPKAIERHNELLFTTLNEKLNQAILPVSELLGKDLSHLKELNSDLQGQYGVLALNALIEEVNGLRDV